MPTDASLPKVAATREYGAEVRLVGSSVDDALAAAHQHARATGTVRLIDPFDHPDIVAGQARSRARSSTGARRRDGPRAQIGGEGLAAGLVAAFGYLAPHVRVVGVQAERMASYPGSLRGGAPAAVEPRSTMADGSRSACPGRSRTT